MDGNATSTSTFELGDDENSFIDKSMSSEVSSIANESILASSHQNSTMNLPISAPSSIARNQIQACSTPKDNLLIKNTIAPNSVSSNQHDDWRNKRDLYRGKGLRNMAVKTPKDGKVYPQNSYMYMDTTGAKQRKREEERIEQEKKEAIEQAREDMLDANGDEYLASFLIVIWQFLYILNVIPNDNVVCYYLNLLICAAYFAFFVAPYPILWAIASCSFIIYMSFVWLFDTNLAYGCFLFVGIFVKAIVTSIQGIIVIRS
uniref:Transmembrane protein n=1 Tax=Caenorhabditis tropicalis TaxID=1561998 RepID=A0A1I7V3J0_9PELO